MKRTFGWLVLGLGFSFSAWAASNVSSIDFKMEGGASLVQIRTDGPVTVDKQVNEQDKQIVLELSGVTLPKNLSRKYDTSSFDSKVSLISPYQADGKADTVRIIVQLRENAAADLAQEGNTIKLSIPNSGGAAPAPAPAETPQVAGAPEAATQPTLPAQSETAASPAPASTPTAETAQAPESPPSTEAPSSASDVRLKTFMETRAGRRFTGRPITLQLRDADVSDVLQLIGEASGFNVVAGDDVKGKITLSLTDVPWDQALDLILHTLKLGAERNSNVLRVVTLAALTAEKREELTAKQAQEASAPRVTKVFPINFANLNEIQSILQTFASGGGAVGEGGGGGAPILLRTEPRTNSLIAQGIPEYVEKTRKLIEILDTQTPQVLVEAKVIEASESFSKNIGGGLGLGGTGRNQFFMSFNAGNPLDQLIGTVFTDGAAAGSSAGSARFGFSPNLGFLPGLSRLNAILDIAEAEETVKVVTSPRSVVLNRQRTSITQTESIPVINETISNGVVSRTQGQITANISLTVTPTVTSEGSVMLDLNLTRDVPSTRGGASVQARNIQTQVLVESGTTLVVGGIYTVTNTEASTGFPFLRKIPIIGWLFGTESENEKKSELFFFVTPRILNEKEAGLVS